MTYSLEEQDTLSLNTLKLSEDLITLALQKTTSLSDKYDNISSLEQSECINNLSKSNLDKFNNYINQYSLDIVNSFSPQHLVSLHKESSHQLENLEADEDLDNYILLEEILKKGMIHKIDEIIADDNDIINQSNIMNTYSQTAEMILYLTKTESKDFNILAKCLKAKKIIDNELATYDKSNNFTKISQEDEKILMDNFNKIKEIIEKTPLNDECNRIMSYLGFESQDSKDIFIDIIKCDALLRSTISMQKNKDADLKKIIDTQLDESCSVQVASLLYTSEFIKQYNQKEGLIDNNLLCENLNNQLNIITPENPYLISDISSAAHINVIMDEKSMWIHRLSTLLEEKNRADIIKKMEKPIKDIEEKSLNHYKDLYHWSSVFYKSLSKNMNNQAVSHSIKVSISRACKMAGFIPAVGTCVYASVSCLQNVQKFREKYKDEKIQEEKKNKKYNITNFFQSNWLSVVKATAVTSAIVASFYINEKPIVFGAITLSAIIATAYEIKKSKEKNTKIEDVIKNTNFNIAIDSLSEVGAKLMPRTSIIYSLGQSCVKETKKVIEQIKINKSNKNISTLSILIHLAKKDMKNKINHHAKSINNFKYTIKNKINTNYFNKGISD